MAERASFLGPPGPILVCIHLLIAAIASLTRPSNNLQAFKTPGRLRGAKTPKTIYRSAMKALWKPKFDIEAQSEQVPTHNASNEQAERSNDVQQPPESSIEQPTEPAEASPVRLYTESELGSPSMNDSPVQIATLTQPTLRQSLGLDTDDMSDDESVDLRAPELIAHEARMAQYDSPIPTAPEMEEEQPEEVLEEPEMPGMYPTIDPMDTDEEEENRDSSREPSPTPTRPRRSLENPRRSSRRSSGKPEIEEKDASATLIAQNSSREDSGEMQVDGSAEPAPREEPKAPIIPRPSATRPASSRLRAPKNIGRPVRPTTAAAKAKQQQPPPTNIKIKPLSHPKPVNTAPVAAHNQENTRPGPSTRPELTKKASSQSINAAFSKSTNGPPPPPPKVFSIAQKKKEADERAAARDAAVKQQQKERRDAKIEELRRKKLEEEAELDRKARDNSAEKRKQHLTNLDETVIKRQKSEERQEREQAEADAKKAAFRKNQAERLGLGKAPPVNGHKRPQNPPPRPPARLDLHEDMRAEEDTPPRFAAHVRVPSLQRATLERANTEPELPAYPSNLNKPPMRSTLTKKPSIFTFTNPQAQAANQALKAEHERMQAEQQARIQAEQARLQAQQAQTLQNFPQPPSRGPPAMIQRFTATQHIPFATPAQLAQHNARLMHSMKQVEESPMSLPEIHTDSSDESDRNVSLPSWATPNHIFGQLSQQETMNADNIFPRIQPIVMDDVFAENPDRLRRLRMRTSSANWVRTGDALNQVEVLEDRIGRQAIRNAGGWVYNVNQ